MTFKIDFRDGDVYRWEVTGNGARYTRDTEYTPTCYVSSDSRDALEEIRPHLTERPDVEDTAFESWQTRLRNDPEPVLRIDAGCLESISDVAHEIRSWGSTGKYTLYNVDFAREFRYCLERSIEPIPDEETQLDTLHVALPAKALSEDDIAPLRIDDEHPAESEREALLALSERLERTDPDVLILSSGELVPVLYRKAEAYNVADFELGRLPGWQQLAAESTFESYGQVGHSPARYNVCGRAIIDTSNSFFWKQTNLGGLLDLVARSWKPIQETAWASIGNVLTSIQIRKAITEGALVPWNSWRHEKFKSMSTLHEADRGGFIFSPDVGLHERVHELDFSSLYPNIMVTRNISPDTIRCDCHSHREDVPGLGYSVCDEHGFLVDVLKPLINDRDRYKRAIENAASPEEREEYKGRSNALKWILVSCFGYQGFSNAKFGRIECHEAINAYAREILLDTKELLESHGWHVLHGIVDSVWVQKIPDESQTPLDIVADEITEEIGIALEYEAEYDWLAFVPRKQSEGGALNRYFGKVAGKDEFKKRGIELRQRSTPPFIGDCQTEWLQTLDEHQEPAPVCDKLRFHLSKLRRGAVEPEDLLIRRRISKELDKYTQYTRSVAALERAETHEFEVAPGEDIEYVVVDDDKRSSARVQLAYESLDRYDEEFYAELLIRAAESVVSPFGWDRTRIKQYLSETDETPLTMY